MKSQSLWKNGFALCVMLAFTLGTSLWGQTTPPNPNSTWLTAMKVPNVTPGINGDGVIVSIIDDSVYMDHSWYKDNLISGITVTNSVVNISGKNEIIINVTDGSNPDNSEQGHGTNTTGCVYQTATSAKLYGIKSTSLAVVNVPTAIDRSMQNNASIISNSYGMRVGYLGNYSAIGSYEPEIQSVYSLSETGAQAINASKAFQRANDAGAVILYAAGNNRLYNGVSGFLNSQDCNKCAYQASTQTITVAATNASNTQNANFSCYGACVFVAAPGESIVTSNYNYVSETEGTEGTVTTNGTSFSCPLTAGCIALATQASRSVGAPMSSRLAKHLLVATSQKIDTTGNTGWDNMDARKTWITNGAGNTFSNTYGFGLVDAEALVNKASEGLGYGVTDQSFLSLYINPGDTALTYSTQAEEVYFSGLTFSSGTGGSFTSTGSFDEDMSLSIMDTETLSVSSVSSVPGGEQLEVSAAGDAMVTVGNASVKANSGTLVETVQYTVDEDDFNTVDFQALEEVALTLAMDGTLGSLEILVTHEGTDENGIDYSTSSIFAFAQETNASLADTEDGVIWTFTSNAFWGEDAAGTWTINLYDMYNTEDLDWKNMIVSYSMGEAFQISVSAVPEPASWALFVFLGGWVLVRFRRKK